MGKRSNPGSRLQMSDTNGLSDHMLKIYFPKPFCIFFHAKLKVEIHPPKKPKIAISDILLDGSLLSPTLSEESFEKELKRARKEFQQFTNDLDKISKRVEKLAETAPEWFADIEEIKIKQDNVEECITATQEKIIENEQRLEQLNTVQEEFNEDINKDLKRIQEQLVELLERHREARSTASMIAQNQSMTTEELDLMLEAIRDYARLIEDASSTIKHFDDVGSPIHYESLDLSPFRTYQGNYFDDH
ncbi:8884_t:CDS:2, partial [Paraglomus occultum]